MIKREDGRSAEQLRQIKIVRDYSKFAEGSCLIEVGNTRVICTASVEENVPQFLRDKAEGWVTAEYGMLPRSCKTRILRERSSGRTYEIQRLIGRALRAIIDLKELGQRTIWIDCDVIQADGGTRTAAITGSFIALVCALENLRKNGILEIIPIKDYVAATSVGIIDGQPLLDLTYEEDYCAQVDMNVVITGKGEFVEIQGTAEKSPFDKRQMDKLLILAKKGIRKLISHQKKILKDIL